ncbi:type I restriction-modification system subunit M [Candidatus Aminicenantes bacterium AC-708-M15]|jgi:type I restriction enzyme M protein|nr:type I restriction-modification system subunit M [SCandidatus Aminicenantes bacterium Aminicenantia_JdfR_composite]MCP2596505.1 type I restriction-modification system subunit M [Candidatus Aminicenantes bacterium AC-335-G13]MCP2603902.1 type I restriction-modification system subunit M [Candidatus Aminicenantes bacterium AC-708-M15]MCP2605714.1 type I restriction-modification system subunit M [Candidatus Aminicenantes bacterium AC-335-O07]MCP2618099.1 type I restriction-modification system su
MEIPKWLERRYDSLWEEFGDSTFRFEQASKVLQEKNKDSEDQVNVILSELRKRGWLKVDFDPHDARKRIYKLISKEKIISEILSINKSTLTRGELESLLKKAADLIRTRVDYTFILILLFYKRISDKWEKDYERVYKEALEDGLSEEEAREEAKNAIYHDFDIPEEFLWENIRKDPARLTENFSKAMKILAERNSELRDVFENIDFVQFTSSRENTEILRQLVELFSSQSFHDVSPDILGDAYEWILRYFAPQKAKEGEVYTPREVIKLIVKILDPQPGESVYDPACGSGGMLIISYKNVENEKGPGEADKLFLYGQEANYKTLALCRMNHYIHDIRNVQLFHGDTLLNPKIKERDRLKKFDVVIANPPWNQDGYDENTLKKGEFWRERFKYGFPTKQSADWAWIQHMLASADDEKGRVGIVIDNGCLFRGGREKSIRTLIVMADLIESIILLPEKLFYNTGAPGAILIFNKNKPEKRKGKILFINASKEFEQHPEVRKLNRLGEKHIDKIADTYKKFKEEEGFSRIVSLDEIKENDYNLNVSLYVFPEEEIEEIDIAKEWQELMEINQELNKVEKKIEAYLKELNYGENKEQN